MVRKILCVAILSVVGSAQAAPVTAGDLLIYRVGSGTGTLTSAATQVFVDEYTTAGTLVQSIAMPTSVSGANGLLTASGTASSEGLINLSSNGQYLMLTGYNAAVGTSGVASTTSASTARTVGVLDLSTGTVDTSTKLTNFSSGNNIRSVASTDGTNIWVGGAATGVAYTSKGSTTATQVSTTITNIRDVGIYGGQLYESDSTGSAIRLGTVGTGLPTTSGQTITNLPGFSTSGSPYSFFFADLSSSVAGMDTLYVADDAAGISKYSLISGNWVSNGTIGAAADTYRGLTGGVVNGVVSLFATGSGGTGATGGGKLVSFADASGFNGALTSTITTLATASANTAFRGVAFVQTSAVPESDSFAMMTAGLAMLGFMARRRKNK